MIKNVCKDHINDKGIQRFLDHGEDLLCDYCKSSNRTRALSDLSGFIISKIGNIYTNPAEFMSYDSKEGGYLGETYSTLELVFEVLCLEVDELLKNDLMNSLPDMGWASQEKHYTGSLNTYTYSWSWFVRHVKHTSRFYFSKVHTDEIVEFDIHSLFERIGDYCENNGMLSTLCMGTPIFRSVRIKGSEESVNMADLVAPPSEKAIYSNRFSPPGISMLYSTLDGPTSLKEVSAYLDSMKSRVVLAQFRLGKDISVLDLTKTKEVSLFLDKAGYDYQLASFMRSFLNEIQKPVFLDEKHHIEYVPTQVFTEYFRFKRLFGKGREVNGIKYASTQNPGGYNLVIFWNNDQCLKNLSLVEKTMFIPELTENNGNRVNLDGL